MGHAESWKTKYMWNCASRSYVPCPRSFDVHLNPPAWRQLPLVVYVVRLLGRDGVDRLCRVLASV